VTITLTGAAGGNTNTYLGGLGARFDVTFWSDGITPFFVSYGSGGQGAPSTPTGVSAGGGALAAVYLGLPQAPTTLLAVAGGGGGACNLKAGGNAGIPGGNGTNGQGTYPAGGGSQSGPGPV
jgi:hypothetical protein